MIPRRQTRHHVPPEDEGKWWVKGGEGKQEAASHAVEAARPCGAHRDLGQEGDACLGGAQAVLLLRRGWHDTCASHKSDLRSWDLLSLRETAHTQACVHSQESRRKGEEWGPRRQQRVERGNHLLLELLPIVAHDIACARPFYDVRCRGEGRDRARGATSFTHHKNVAVGWALTCLVLPGLGRLIECPFLEFPPFLWGAFHNNRFSIFFKYFVREQWFSS